MLIVERIRKNTTAQAALQRRLAQALEFERTTPISIDWKSVLSDIYEAGFTRALLADTLHRSQTWLRWTVRREKYKDIYYEDAVKLKHIHGVLCSAARHTERFSEWGKVLK